MSDANGTNVIFLTPRPRGPVPAALSEIRAYWEALRGDRLVPSRAELDPRGMARSIEQAFVAERVAAGVMRFRVAGLALADLAGFDVRGMPVSALFTAAGRVRLAAACEAMFATPSAAEISLDAERGIGRPACAACLLLLPMRTDDGTISRALGCIVTDGRIGRRPRRFEVTDVRLTPLAGRAERTPVPVPAQPVAALAEAPAPFAHPGLRLVRTDS